jgi:hypothetical protein
MSFRKLAIAGLSGLSAASCSGRLEGPDGSSPGEAVDALASAYCISDVQVDPRTYHFDSPRWVLQAAEGVGPRVLAVTIAGYAAPLVSTTLAQHPPKDGELSAAVGYSLGEYYYLQSSAAYTVDSHSEKRLEAYINYARSAWVIREAGCGAVLGAGISFKPIGIYFAARDSGSAAVPGASAIGILPDGAGGPVGYAPGPGLASPPPSHAGAADAGAADAGTADAGAADAGAADTGAP